jgi:4-hydroxy-3-methylbut-2-enyl diphosphate reductase
LTVRFARIASSHHVVRGPERRMMAERGARAVDMESFWLSPLARGRAFSIARVIVDTPQRELTNPLHTLAGGWRALGILRRVGRAVAPRATEA